MLLSEMFGVERDVDFCVEMFEGKFRIMSSSGRECLYFKSEGGDWGAVTAAWMLYSVIESAPSGIIHLPPPLTDEQRTVLMALYTLGARWIAKDENETMWAYKEKPLRCYNIWRAKPSTSGDMKIFNDAPVSLLVSWSDPEPFDIGKALGVGE
jgi:hypothetical protein